MLNIFFLIHIIVKIYYPTNDIDKIRFINNYVDKALKTYCFIDLEYSNTTIDSLADVIIIPNTLFEDPTLLGFTRSNILYNSKIKGIPTINLVISNDGFLLEKVLVHELGHFLGLTEHSIDSQSIYYWLINDVNKQTITRYDSLMLKSFWFLK